MSLAISLADLSRCLQGVVPGIIATADDRGMPNVTYVSQVHTVDDGHVALSCQFFNKTRRNLDVNPFACVEVYDPLTLQAYRLRLKFIRSEKSGPLFDTMSLRIDAIASHTGMTGIFRLIAADVFEVRSTELVRGFLAGVQALPAEGASLAGLRTEMRGLQWVSDRINRAPDLEQLLHVVLESLEEFFGFAHTTVLLYEESSGKLVTLGSRGYGSSGAGAEVCLGDGVIGTVARERRILRLTSLDADLRYGRAIRREVIGGPARTLDDEVPVPGLPDAQSVLAIPLAVGPRLVGVLVAEDRDPIRFGEWHEAYLEIVGNQIAFAIDRMRSRPDENDDNVENDDNAQDVELVASVESPERRPADASGRKRRRLTYYKSDDAIFIDDEYLIRNVAARILWKVLGESQRTGRTEFTNREMRLDAGLGLPPIKDNLESRLILLRQRLLDKCPDVQLISTGRGRFGLRTASSIEMIER
jgi:adenylate cyclase